VAYWRQPTKEHAVTRIRTSLGLLGIAVACVWSVATFAQSPAKTPAKPKVQLPAAVASAFKAAYPDARIKNVAHETEDGIEQYEIESTNNGKGLDVNYKPDGSLLVVEEQLAATDLPAAVATAISKRYPKATLGTCERATENKKVSYEIGLKGAPVKTVQLNPDGSWISPKLSK
jgi:hypothetical protein